MASANIPKGVINEIATEMAKCQFFYPHNSKYLNQQGVIIIPRSGINNDAPERETPRRRSPLNHSLSISTTTSNIHATEAATN